MARWDDKKKIFYYTGAKNYETGIQDRDEGNYYRAIFNYDEVPKIDFDMRIIPIAPPDDIWITDTTFRDGQQSMTPFSVKQIETIFDFLHRIGGKRGLVRASEFFLYTKKDKAAVEACLGKGYEYPHVTSWIRAHKDDLKLVKEMGLNETGILTSVSDYHIFLKMNLNRRKALEEYLGIVKDALAAGIIPRCHFEDVTRADIYGFCVPFARELMRLREESGIDIKIRLCDTLGYGVNFPGAALPRAVDKLVRAFIDDGGVPGELLEWHGHNDFHKVHINGTTAWLYGCDALNSTLFGFGERTGNPPLEGAVFEYIALKGSLCGIDTLAITELADYMRSIGLPIPDNYPFAGHSFNVTRAGIHAGGLRQDERIYNIFDTEKLLGRPPRVAITDKSGADGVVHWVNEFFGLKGDDRINKIKVHRLARWVIDQYDVDGRLTPISDQELAAKAKEFFPDYWAKYKANV